MAKNGYGERRRRSVRRRNASSPHHAGESDTARSRRYAREQPADAHTRRCGGSCRKPNAIALQTAQRFVSSAATCPAHVKDKTPPALRTTDQMSVRTRRAGDGDSASSPHEEPTYGGMTHLPRCVSLCAARQSFSYSVNYDYEDIVNNFVIECPHPGEVVDFGCRQSLRRRRRGHHIDGITGAKQAVLHDTSFPQHKARPATQCKTHRWYFVRRLRLPALRYRRRPLVNQPIIKQFFKKYKSLIILVIYA